METQAHLKAFSEIQARMSSEKDRVIAFIRPLVGVLKDSGQMATAAALEEKLFVLDAIEGELTNHVRQHGQEIFREILNR